MKLIIAGARFEQEIKPLVRSFYQNEDLETEIKDWQEEVDTFGIENGLVIYCGAEDYHVLLVKNSELAVSVKGSAEEERKAYRNKLARSIYEVLSKETGRTLPWGILTGVRPTKLVYEQAEAGVSEEEIRRYMKQEYFCSDEKTDVSLSVTRRERELLNAFDYKNEYSLYVGIPFCPTVCAYCSFTSFPLKGFDGLVEPYLAALFKELEAAKDIFPGRKISSVYFGGGTPTTLSADQLERLITKVQATFDLSACREFTVEAGRPDSITEDKLRVLKKCGVDRISINPQSMNAKTLEAIGRRHTPEQIVEVFKLARECGHDNINMDIILGLSGESPEDVKYTLEEIRKLSPDSLTVHTLALKRAARYNIEQKRFKDIGAENVSEMLKLSSDFAKAENYGPYYLYRQKNMAENLENVGYARYGKESLYNILIMEEKQTILACGAGASSKIVFNHEQTNENGVRIERIENVKDVKHYIERVDEMIERKKNFFKENALPF